MKFTVYKASDWEYEEEVEINTLEELIKFREKCHRDIIIQNNYNNNEKLAIMIYDGYLE